MNPERLLDLREPVIELALRAGKAIMEVYARDFSVETKDDRSPLTEADLAAHHILLDGLQQLTPEWPVLSEESAAIDTKERLQWETLWVVDPLDGTREFVKRNGEFTVNIALVHQYRAVLGVIVAPALNELAWGVADVAAFERCDGLDQRLRTRTCASDARVRVVGSRSHRSAEEQAMLDRLDAHESHPVGSSIKFIRIAQGAADVYFRLGPTSEWDTAAGQCILEAAGGVVRDVDGNALRYNARESLLNPHFIAAGDPSRRWF